ncbi:MAG TPA: ATP-binding protein [Geobacteraceae bacterium]|nr:ATP-binding protein [Geobacteraceae bacterium]
MKIGLRYKFIGITLLSALPFLLYAIIHYHNAVTDNKDRTISRNQSVAEETAEKVADFINSSQSVLYSLALHPAIINNDSKKCDEIFGQLLPLYPAHDNILVADMNGRNFGSGLDPKKARNLNYSDREWFRRGSKGVSYVSDLYSSKLLHNPVFMITMPVFESSGPQKSVLGFPVNLLKLKEHLTELEKIDKTAYFCIIDNKGIILIDSNNSGTVGTPFKQEPLLKKISKRLTGSLVDTDQTGTEHFYSHATVSTTGWKVLVGKPSSTVYAEANIEALRHLIFFILICLTGGLSSIWYSRKLGGRIEAIVNGLNEVAAGNYSCHLIIPGNDEIARASDAFNRMTAERGKHLNEIKTLTESLERRVQIRTAELLNSKNELEAFSYAVSHDLHAPVRHILAFTRILMEEHSQELSSECMDHLQRINRAGENMKEMITHLLDLSRLNRQEITRIMVNISALSKTIVADLTEAESDRSVKTVIAEGLTTYADPTLLRIVLHNLIGNAWKFTRKCPSAEIEIGETVINEIRCFFVKDNGCGFDMSYSEKLFAPFQRLHSPEEFEGTGIGLATVMRIIQRHGGKLWAESTPGKGAVFYFTIMSLDA